MPKFKVSLSEVVYYEMIVEAETEGLAHSLAQQLIDDGEEHMVEVDSSPPHVERVEAAS